ncbi:hypothetical protein [Rufibacter sp. DG15C]|uniref:hypothetical protein n=1 Tax=Rufibacter sp. DG15C TaxID=1379909 RepID=UPI000A5CC79C|nr:hypothetical protein [Rufibacter sp. DG15C]
MSQIKVKELGLVSKPEGRRSLKSFSFYFLSLLFTPIILLGGLLFMIPASLLSLYQRFSWTKGEKLRMKAQLTKSSTIEQWTYWTEMNSIKLYQNLEGEIRFGPGYFSVKSEPLLHDFDGKTFGGWFFHYKDGIFLQQWDSTKSPHSSLLYFDTVGLTIIELKTQVPSVIWEMEVLEENQLQLNCDTGYKILELRIELGTRD